MTSLAGAAPTLSMSGTEDPSMEEGTGMTRSDTHMDAMLRHLGAAYYESLHGRASAADVARARAAIEERMAEQPDATDRPGDGKDQG